MTTEIYNILNRLNIKMFPLVGKSKTGGHLQISIIYLRQISFFFLFADVCWVLELPSSKGGVRRINNFKSKVEGFLISKEKKGYINGKIKL